MMSKKLTSTTLIILLFTSVVAVSFITANTYAKAQTTQSSHSKVAFSQNSQDFKNCLPKQIKKAELMGAATDSQNAYYLLGVYGKQNEFWEELIRVNSDNQCNSLISQANLEDWPSKYVPMKIAQELALQMYTKLIEEAGGKEKYQQAVIEASQNDPQPQDENYLPPEYEWALKQLGIRIPFRYTILDPRADIP